MTAQDQPDADSTPGDGQGDDSATVAVQAFPPDLALAVSASTQTPVLGETMTLTVDLTSQNAARSTGVDVAAAVPAGFELVSSAPSQGTYNGRNGTWSVGAVAGTGAARLVLTVRPVSEGVADFAAEVARMNQPDGDSTPGNGSTTEDDDDRVTLTTQTIDLELALAVSDATPRLGDTVTYTVTLDNAGAATATGVSVRARLPDGLTFVSATPGATYNAATGEWTVGGLAASGRTTLDIVARVASPTPAPLVAEVSAADQPDRDSTPDNDVAAEDDQAAQPLAVEYADLALDVSSNTAAPAAGQTVTLFVDLTNEGTVDATGVVARAPLPAGYAFVSATPSQGAYNDATGEWTVGAVAVGATPRLQIVATAAAGAATFTGEVTAQNEPDADSAPGNGVAAEDDQDSIDLTGETIDLALAVVANDPSPDFGDDVEFTITLTNDGQTTATGTRVLAPLPPGYTYVSALPAASGTYDAATGVWRPGPLAPGQSVSIVVRATAETLDPSTFTAEVTAADQTDANSTPGDGQGDDFASTTVTAQPIDLSLVASVDDASPALGDDVTFSLRLANAGPAAASGVSVRAPLPAGYTFVSATPGVGYNAQTGVWTIPDLPAGQTLDLQIVATATTTDRATFAPEVTAADQPDADSAPGDGAGDDAATVAVQAQPTDLALTLSVDDAAPAVGERVTFTIDLTNQSATGATGVDVSALLPAGFSAVSGTTSQGAYDAARGTWSVGAVGPNGAARLVVTATVVSAEPQAVTAQVASADQPDADSTPGNDDPAEDDQASVTVAGQPTDLALTVAASDTAPGVGETVTFTVTLDNQSAVAANGVDVSALLPAGYTFVDAAPSTGAYNAGTGRWSVGDVAASGRQTLTVTATAQTLDPSAFTAEVTAATPTDADSTPGNGVEAEDDQDSVALQAQPIDLSLVASVDDASPALGDDVTFSLRLANAGPAGATGVTVAAPLPAGYTFVSSTPGVDYDPATGEWTVPTLAAGQTLDLQIVATATTTDPVVFAPEVTAADQPDADSTPGDGTGDDAATVAVSAQPTDLALAIAASDPAPAVGETVTFTVTLDNQSASRASGIDVATRLTDGLSIVSATPSQGTYTNGDWTVGTLAAGGQATLQIVATVTEVGAQTAAAEVVATAEPDADSTPGNDDPAEDDQASVTVAGQPTDLALTVAASDTAPGVGQDVTFTVTLDNQSPTTATGARVAALLPTGYTFVSAAPSQGSYNPTTGTWTAGTLAGQAQATLAVVATATTTDARTFTAQVSAASPADVDSTPGNDVPTEDDQDSVDLQAAPTDLALSLVASNPSPGVGEETTLTLTLDNESAVAASGVTARLPVPDGYTLVSVTEGQGTYDAGTGRWSVGAVAGRGQATLTVVLRADALAPVTVTAEVTAQDQADRDSAPGNGVEGEDDQQTITLSGRPIDLELAASVDDASPALGQRVTYTVTLDNASAAGATGVEVAAALPAGVRFESATAAGGTYDAGTGRWAVGPLAAGGRATLTVTGTVTDPAPGVLTAQVTVADQADADSNPNNGDPDEDDQASVALTVEVTDLELALAVSDPTPVPGQQVTFSLTLDNALGSAASGVTVSAPLPAGFTYVSSTPGVAYDPATGTWTVGTVPGNGTVTLDIVATVAADSPATMTAEVATSNEPDVDSAPGNGDPAEDDLARVAVTPQVVDLALDMTVDEPQPNAGDVVTFVVTLTNEGDTGATGVQVSDRLVDRPGVAEVVSATPSRGTFDGALWTVGPLAAGASETLTVRVRLVADRVAFTNLAEVARADQPDRDSAPYNGSTAEDDDAAATATTGGSSSGGEGGLESGGSLAEAIGAVLFARRAEAGALADAGVELAPVAFSRSRTAGASLRRFLPTTGPRGSAAVEVSPTDLLPVTNAREIVAADYVRGDGRRAGVVFAAATDPGEVYEHTKPVCDRLRGATLAGVELVDVAGHPFVMVRLVQADGSVDYAVSLVAYGPAASRTVDSRFLLSEYAVPADDHSVLNLQAWSPSREYTVQLVRDLLAGLRAEGALGFRNAWSDDQPTLAGEVLATANPFTLADGPTAASGGAARDLDESEPALPTVFVRSASYAAGRIDLDVYNAGGATTLHVTGGTLARAEGGGRTAFERTVEVARGTPDDPSVPVSIDTGYLFDAAFFVASDLSPHPDRLYLADGTWGVATDRSSGPTRLDNFAVRPQADDPAGGPVGPGQRLVERPVRATGTVATWATVYRTLRPSAAPVDLSAYRYVEFTAAGEGEVQLLVQKASVASADQYGRAVRLTPGPRAHRVWFEDLHRADGARGFTGGDVVALSFTARSDGTPRPLDVAVSGLRFGGADGDASAVPDEPSLWAPMPNPFSGSTRVRYELAEPQRVRVRVFDVLGREVARLADGDRAAGRHTVPFDGRGLAAGVYVVRLEAGGRSFTRQMTLVR